MNVNSNEYQRQAGEVDLYSIFRIVWSRRYLIIAVTVLFGIASVIFALTATPIFRAEVVVTEVRDSELNGAGAAANQLGGLASLVGVNLLGANMDRKAQAVLNSRRLIEEFIKRHVPLEELSGGGAPLTLWKAVEAFADDVLEIQESQLSGVTVVAIEWTDPNVSARWANDFVALANELLRTRALDESTRNIRYLNDQISKTDVVELRRVLYNLVENEAKTQMLANARPEYAFTIIDPAVPPEIRWYPKRTLIVLLGLLAGGFVGVLFAFAHHAWRTAKARELAA
jgi:uncharacterized protein involved in exopolysaccharide biosynthesis